MQHLIYILEASGIVKSIIVLKNINDKEYQDFYLKTLLNNNTCLFIHETRKNDLYKYVYHWQTKIGKLLIRWDNSPHYSKLETQPHHKHLGSRNKIESSYETDLTSVLNIIAKKIA